MSIFTNKDYEALANDIIKDSFYADNSYGGKIQAERRCAELIIRKVLKLDSNVKVTLGNHQVVNQISSLPHHLFFENAIKVLKPFGDTNSHTGEVTPPIEEDYEKVTNGLFDMFAYLPIRFFDKYKFGSNSNIVRAFSLLPPVIRYKSLNYLYSIDSQNVCVIDKLSLAILKTKGFDETMAWLNSHKNEFESLKTFSDEAYDDVAAKNGEDIARIIANIAPDNLYACCVDRIEKVNDLLDSNGHSYQTFEEALPYYLQYKSTLDDSKADEKEFIDMMDFLYLGRKRNN